MRRLKMKLKGALAVTITLILAACGADPQEDENVLQEIDPPQEIEFINENEELDVQGQAMDDENGEVGDSVTDMDGDGEADEAQGVEEKGGPVDETVMKELYLLDSNGYVAPLSLPIATNTGSNEIENIINHLVHGGPIVELLPNGFQAVLPSGTEVLDIEVSNGVATIDFSEGFTEYHPNQELQLLEALTWSVTELDGINRVKLKVNGEPLTTMPKNGTPIGDGYTRNHGINLEMTDVEDITNTSSAIVYFISQTDENTNYIPVTRRIPNDGNKYEAVVNELLKGPNMWTPLLTDFRESVKLLEEPSYSSGTVTLNFNEAILDMLGGTAISEDVLNTIVLSLTELNEVEEVAFLVESNDSILVSSGENISDPVTRPEMVNTGEY